MYLKFNNIIKEFSDDVFKISTYFNSLDKERSFEEEPIPVILSNKILTDSEIVNIFEKWFKALLIKKINEEAIKLDNLIFKSIYFTDYTVEQLIEIFNFAIGNQIKLLCETIAYVISQKINKIYIKNSKYYIINDDIKDDLTVNIVELHYSLLLMVLKHMKDSKFDEQITEIKNLLPNHKYFTCNYYPEAADTSFNKRDNLVCCKKIRKNEFIEKLYTLKLYIPDEVIKINNLAFKNIYYVDLIGDYIKYYNDYGDIEIDDITENKKQQCIITKHKFSYCDVIVINGVMVKNSADGWIPPTVKEIANYNYTFIRAREITIPKTVEKIDSGAFGQSRIREINIRNPNIIIEPDAFKNCDSLRKINCPQTLSSDMFKNCPYVEIIINKNGKRICEKASVLTNLNNVDEIRPYAFDSIEIDKLEIPEHITEIGEQAFANSKIYDFVLHNVKKIGYEAFKNSLVHKINLENVDEIGYGAFEDCPHLLSISCKDTIDVFNIFGNNKFDVNFI